MKDEGLNKQQRFELSFDCADVLSNKGSWKYSNDRSARNTLRLIRQVDALESRISELEKRAAWAGELLDEAFFIIHAARATKASDGCAEWIEAYEKGPSEGNGGGG